MKLLIKKDIKKRYDHSRYLRCKESIKRAVYKYRKTQRGKEVCRKSEKKFERTPQGIYKTIKVNSFNKGRTLNISKDDFCKWHITQEKYCYYCHIPENKLFLLPTKPNCKRVTRLTIDRMDNNLPYQLGNIVLACDLCNYVKSYLFTLEEMKEIAQKYIKPKWEALCDY